MNPWSGDGLVEEPKYRAILHMVHPGLDDDGKQRCIMCGATILNHRRQMLNDRGLRVDADGVPILGFRMGPVTTVYPPEPHLPPITVAGHVKYARPCTVPEQEWPHA